MNFLGRIKLGVAGAEVGSLKANNEKIFSLRPGRYCSKAGRDMVEYFLLNTGTVKFRKVVPVVRNYVGHYSLYRFV